jgi:uncharacterized protein (TIGR00725 family)
VAGPRVASVFGSATLRPGDPEYASALRLGRLLAGAGWTVMTGGYDGAMAAVSQGAREAGADVIGITVEAWRHRLQANRWVTEERPAPDLPSRLATLVRADALLAVGGGVGTLSEVALAWHLRLRGEDLARPLVVIGERWRRLVATLVRELGLTPADAGCVRLAGGPDDAVAMIG